MGDDSWTLVGSRADIASRRLRRARVRGVWVALHMWNDAVCAILDACPHRGATLSNGTVSADGYVECPEHGWEFHLVTACGRQEFEGCTDRYEVLEREGDVYVRTVS